MVECVYLGGVIVPENNGVLYDKTLGCLLGGVIGDAMGGPAENKTYQEVQEQFGEITDFTGAGTDDSALKHILCDAIIKTGGHPTADAWAEEWLAQDDLFRKTNLFYIPVKNAFWKIRGEGAAPREAGHGNMASSSSAMCISPMGIINAGNPRQAALETFEVASLIHHNFCRDAACAMAAAVAEAFKLRGLGGFDPPGRLGVFAAQERLGHAGSYHLGLEPRARNPEIMKLFARGSTATILRRDEHL